MRALALVAFLLVVPALAEAQDPALVDLLSGVEWVPGPQDLASRGVRPADLIALYGAEGVPLIVQVRAVGLLVHFQEPAVETFLVGVARARRAHPAVLRTAAASLAPFGDGAVPTLRRLLCHRDRSVREAAARALGAIRTPRSWEVLRRRRRVERDPTVRRAIDVALAVAPTRP